VTISHWQPGAFLTSCPGTTSYSSERWLLRRSSLTVNTNPLPSSTLPVLKATTTDHSLAHLLVRFCGSSFTRVASLALCRITPDTLPLTLDANGRLAFTFFSPSSFPASFPTSTTLASASVLASRAAARVRSHAPHVPARFCSGVRSRVDVGQTVPVRVAGRHKRRAPVVGTGQLLFGMLVAFRRLCLLGWGMFTGRAVSG